MTALPPTILDSSVTLTWAPAGQYYGYCKVADVEFEFTNIANMPKAADPSAIAQEISYAAAVSLQSLLNPFYEMPYAGSDASILLTLRELNVKQAVAMLIDRYMAANDQMSGVALACSNRVAGIVHEITNGIIRWDPPFGDAVKRAELPVYPRASLVTVSPNPTLHPSQRAVFGMRRPRFRRGMAF